MGMPGCVIMASANFQTTGCSIYVFPISGWWRERKALGRAESKSRYALVVGIETPDVDVDLITPIATELANLIAAGVAIET